VLLVLPVPAPPSTLAVSCDPSAVEPMLALPVPSPPLVAVPAAEPFVPVVPEPEPRLLAPVPIALLVVPVDDKPPVPSVALSVAPALPLLETPAPLPAAPPLSDDAAVVAAELLSPEFSFPCELAALEPPAPDWPLLGPCTSVPA